MVLAARIDRLAPDDKRLLQAAAVIGKDVPFALLQAIADVPEEDLHRGLAHLQAAEFLYEMSLFPDLGYTFKHPLTHEVAYGSLLQERRRALHVRVVTAIENLYPERLAEHVERLAHHALRSQVWDRASAYLRQAGARAAERSAHRAAVDYLEQALVALEHLPDTRDTLACALDVRFDLHASLFPLAEYGRMRGHMEVAEQVAVALGDRYRLARALSLLCPALRLANEKRRSAEVGRRALAIAVEVGDQRLVEDTSFRLGQTYTSLGDHRGAEPFYRRNITPLPINLTPEAARALPLFASNARAWLATSLTQLGRFDEGLTLGADALRVAQALDDKFRLIIAHSHLGWLHLHRGTLTDSVRHLEQAVALGRSWDISDTARGSAVGLATAYAHLGRIEEALEYIGPRLGYFSPLRCGEIYFLAGQREKALEAAAQALTSSQQAEERGLEGWALYLLATIRANGDLRDWDQGEEHFRAALTRAKELSMRPLVAHCHLGLGKLYRRTGDAAKAQEHLTTATAMYREMGMSFWLEKADAELRGVDR